MSFVKEFNELPLQQLLGRASSDDMGAARASLDQGRSSLADFATLISPGAGRLLEEMGRRSQNLTRQRFGRVMRFFAPLYLSNECINNCKYCGFSRDNPILRVTLSTEEVAREGRALTAQGFRNVLLVSGEHPKFAGADYLTDCVKVLRPEFPGISLEVGPMETAEYEPLCRAGAEGLVVYQETYDKEVYAEMHTAGPKRNFDWRLETPERAYVAGFRRLGVGALFGLSDWKTEALSLAAHVQYLLRHCWKAQITVSLPRLKKHAGDFEPLTTLADRQMAQLICALRLTFPDAGLVLSTREPANLRDGLMPLGITHVSAGSHTEPGGYTGAGSDKIHRTERGRMVALDEAEPLGLLGPSGQRAATVQFEISDARSPEEVAARVRSLGYEPVWKDWDLALAS